MLLVEGEKTAEVAREIVPGFVVTTWPHGGKSTGKMDWTPLEGRNVTCWPDADADGKGIKTMEKAAEKIAAAGAKLVAIVKLPEGLPDTWDLANPLPDGWTSDTVMELIEAVQPVTPAALTIIFSTDWHGAVVPERKWVVDKLLPHSNVTMLSGDGGLGKSQLALQLLINAALSRHWLGYPTLACKTLGVFCEDDEDELHRRTFWTCQDLGVELCDLQNLALINRVGLDSIMVQFDAQERGHPTPFFNQVLEQAQEFGARLVVLDSLHDIFAGNENSRPQARHFVNALRRIAIAIDGAVLITAHPSLSGRSSGTGEAGSTAWHNAVRSRLYLTSPAQQDGEDVDPNRRILTNKKANYGRLGEVIECEWRNGVFVPLGQGLSKSTRENQAEETFLECLDLLTTRGTAVSEAATSSSYAPKKMTRMKESGKFGKRDLERAMERLFSAGAITNEQIGIPSKQRNVIVRAESEQS